MSFEKILRESELILTEGAIVERLKSEFNIKVSSSINHAGLIYTNPEFLEAIYRQYLDIGQNHNLPIMIMTPTRKVNFETIKNSKFKDKNIIADSCFFINEIKKTYNDYESQIMLGGLMGCKGDAYKAKDALNSYKSYNFHQKQAIQFENENVDFLFAGIMPEIYEAIGTAQAMAETKIPYIISFMIRKDGCLIDGTSISDAIKLIDKEVNPNPVCYMTNCVHPTNLRLALSNDINKDHINLKRFLGIQANASVLEPEELNNCNVLHQDDFKIMIDEMKLLYKQFELKIFGGCCGTNDRFINSLAINMKSEISEICN